MSVQPSWLDSDQTILTLEFPEKWTVEDYEKATRWASEVVIARREPVIVLLQFAENQPLPKGFFARAYKLHQRIPANQTASIIVGTSPFVRSTFGILQRVFARRNATIRLANTLEDALAMCQQAGELR